MEQRWRALKGTNKRFFISSYYKNKLNKNIGVLTVTTMLNNNSEKTKKALKRAP